MGYHRAGFEVMGVDIKPQKHYPFPFLQMDALEAMDRLSDGELLSHIGRAGLTFSNGDILLAGDIDAYHASSPCQAYTLMARGLLQSQHKAGDYPRLIEPTRVRLIATGRPYVIENVPGSPLLSPLVLCGSSFGLKVQRHRLFESNVAMLRPPCAHYWQGKEPLPALHRLRGRSRVVGCYGNGRGKGDNKALWAQGLGITWMTRKEMSQAIPPAYTEYIGGYLMKAVLHGAEVMNDS